MAPGKKRGAKVTKVGELNLGDLVLAKVKGFPFWPAKVSRPEDHKQIPDPRKYFVWFFGTQEIAFVAPADIQAFTIEKKNELTAKCQGKGKLHKNFPQAVEQICDEFEKLQQKDLNGIRNDSSAPNLASETISQDAGVDGSLDVNDGTNREELKCKSEIEVTGVHSVLGGCSHKQDEMKSQDAEPCLDADHNLSPHTSPGNMNKLVENPANINQETRQSTDIKVTTAPQTKLESGTKKKIEGAGSRNYGSDMQRKNVLGGIKKVSSVDNIRAGSDVNSKRKDKQMMREKKHSEVANEENSEDHMPRKKPKPKRVRESTEASRPAKMSKGAGSHDTGVVIALMSREKNQSKDTKAENRRPPPIVQMKEASHSNDDEDELPPMKRHRQAVEATSTSSVVENKMGGSASRKKDLVPPNKIRSPVMQYPKKRRAVLLCNDDDEDELPKTPIHGGFSNKVSTVPRLSDSKNKLTSRNMGAADSVKEKLAINPVRLPNRNVLPTPQQETKKMHRELSPMQASLSTSHLDSDRVVSAVAKPILLSPIKSPHSTSGSRQLVESQNKQPSKVHGDFIQKKAAAGASRGLGSITERLPQNLSSERSKPAFVGEKGKSTSKSSSINPVSHNERLDIGKERRTTLTDAKTPDSISSMKNLIAAAQARKKQAHMQDSYGNSLSYLVHDADLLVQIPSPPPAIIAVESPNLVQPDQHENEEIVERRVSSGRRATGSSLSGGTEAAVARDAFEGMIETLSRTKESIGRATRLAIDCAKQGIANEVVELLIKKLENESSFHRRVDLFFLVDSITQCSHSQKGAAGASYIPIVQAALPRLIGAAAPSGSGAKENRHQCHKVLRLWLERKILPESVLRRHIDDIGVGKDEMSAGFLLRRPSRAERAIDDPIREMEGMWVDEYGSNTTFQVPGLMPSHAFDEEEDEDDFLQSLGDKVADSSPLMPTPGTDPENYPVTPSDRRHLVLEEVDGELEMEDVSGHKSSSFVNGNVELERKSNQIHETDSDTNGEFLPSPISPPLPYGTPPLTPPLPTSPPPPPSPSPPPPPPPPPPPQSTSSSPPPPSPQSPPPPSPPPPPQPISSSPPSPPPPPPLLTSAPSSQQHMFPPPYAAQPLPQIVRPPLISQQPLQHQMVFMSQHMPPRPLVPEVSSAPAGPQRPAMVPITRPAEYGQGDAYIHNQQRQPFFPCNAPFQRPVPPECRPQLPPSHFSYASSSHQFQYRPSYALPNFPDGSMRNGADGPRGGWMAGGRSSSGHPYMREGYYGPPTERPLPGAVTYQPSGRPDTFPAVTSIPVHSFPMRPGRPDMAAVNWRP